MAGVMGAACPPEQTIWRHVQQQWCCRAVPDCEGHAYMLVPAKSGGATSPHETARRLLTIMEYMKLSSVRDFAEFIGCQRSQVSNWLQGYHYPRVPDMSVLCEKLNNEVTLDWIYRGVPSGMPYAMTIHLTTIMEGIEGPAAPPHEPHETPSIAPIAKAAAATGRRLIPKKSAKAGRGRAK
jgi:transcriptional regulator with XRE-family HTH domain